MSHHDPVSTGSTHQATGSTHQGHDPAQFKRRFWISLALSVPTLIFSTGLQEIIGLSGPRFDYSAFIPAAFGTALFAAAASRFSAEP